MNMFVFIVLHNLRLCADCCGVYSLVIGTWEGLVVTEHCYTLHSELSMIFVSWLQCMSIRFTNPCIVLWNVDDGLHVLYLDKCCND